MGRKKKEDEPFDWEAWESEARKRSAWGQYAGTMNHIRLVENEQIVQSLPKEKQEAKRKELADKVPNGGKLYIG